MNKNTAGQKWRVFAFSLADGAPVTGDAANITAKLSIDFGTATALTDTNPAETEDGYYLFDLTQAETNGHDLAIYPQSSTTDVVVIGCPENHVTVDYSTLATASALSTVEGKVDTIDGIIDAILVDTAEIGAAGAGLTALASAAALATVDAVVDAILVDTDTTIPALIDALPTAAETWAHVIESGFTAAQVMRILSAVAAGSASGLENGSPSFTGLDGATTRVAGTYATGTRTVTTVDGA